MGPGLGGLGILGWNHSSFITKPRPVNTNIGGTSTHVSNIDGRLGPSSRKGVGVGEIPIRVMTMVMVMMDYVIHGEYAGSL